MLVLSFFPADKYANSTTRDGSATVTSYLIYAYVRNIPLTHNNNARYDYDPRWFCDRDTPKDCEPGWPGWRWDQPRGASLGRAYNYAHVSSQYLGMYQAAEYDLLKTIKPRVWYLTRAYKTIVAMAYQASWYSSQGPRHYPTGISSNIE